MEDDRKESPAIDLPFRSACLLRACWSPCWAWSWAQPIQAALIEGGKGPQLLIGRDDDNIDNPHIQAGAAANQSSTAPTFSKAGRAMT